jgi:general secretion pathway protein B
VSYILDALKKAEADRDPDTRARLAFEVREQRRNRSIITAVLVALIANAVILLWVFLPDDLWVGISPREDGSTTAVTPAERTTGSLAPMRSASSAAIAPSATASPGTTSGPAGAEPDQPAVSRPSPAAAAEAAKRTPATVPSTAPQPLDMAPDDVLIGPNSTPVSSMPVSLGSLPDAMRRRFPTLSFSTHIYADEPDLRAVVVNGRRLVEGDQLGTLTLERITEDGAVFLFEGRQVEIGVLDAWD